MILYKNLLHSMSIHKKFLILYLLFVFLYQVN
nr:MAG TPA: hypothetical protein [Caudoviricetes sp.]